MQFHLGMLSTQLTSIKKEKEKNKGIRLFFLVLLQFLNNRSS
jgi:hypothetical protein